MSDTSDYYDYIDTTGIIIPDTSDILTDVQGTFQTAFGADLSVNPATPQGILITGDTTVLTAVVKNNAALANQINPNYAGGIFLDAVGALTGLQRVAATQSYVMATLTGVANTQIAEGVLAKTVAGDLFQSTGAVVIGSEGTAEVAFQSVAYGPIGALAGNLNQIVTKILGWETINNPGDAVLGVTGQSDQAYRAKRKVTLALQGVSLAEAITSALNNVAGVTSISFRENQTSETATIDGVTLVPSSVYACVQGGTDSDIAAALLENKSGGCNWNGSVTVSTIEAASGQAYTVSFDRPTSVPIKVMVTVKVNDALIDPVTAVMQAILDYANGLLDNEKGFIVGGSVSPFQLAGAVNRETPEIYIQDVQVTTIAANSFGRIEIPIAIYQIATLVGSNIQVTVAT